jgi:DNA-binding NtrC family response regulator
MTSGSRRVSGELVRAYAMSQQQAEQELIAVNRRARLLLSSIAQVAPTEQAVLISGETGTGKTMVARLIHAQSASAALPLRVINCAALRDALLAEALWELDREATVREEGTMPRAVLLDEVGELSPWSQAVLLRKLESTKNARPTLRWISATHRELDVMAASGTFSRELLSHLRGVRLPLAPLRYRREEIAPLAMHFLRLALQSAGTAFVSIELSFLECLEHYDWPGNARELKNAMIRSLAINETGTLSLSELPDAVRLGARGFNCDTA